MAHVMTFDDDAQEAHMWQDAGVVVIGHAMRRSRTEPEACFTFTPYEARLMAATLIELAGYAEDEIPSALTGKTPTEEHNEWDALRSDANKPK